MSNCNQCGKPFACAMADPGTGAPCWCTRMPTLPAEYLGRDGPNCYCADCLARLLAGSQRDAGKT